LTVSGFPLIEALRASARVGSLPKKDCSRFVEYGKVEIIILSE